MAIDKWYVIGNQDFYEQMQWMAEFWLGKQPKYADKNKKTMHQKVVWHR